MADDKEKCTIAHMSRFTGEIKSFRDLQVYRAAFALQQEIFRASKTWPRDEAYSLTDQIRRSSRSVGANVAEAWGKRKYAAHFLSKLTDADGELQETRHWLATATSCGYVSEAELAKYKAMCDEIGRMVGR